MTDPGTDAPALPSTAPTQPALTTGSFIGISGLIVNILVLIGVPLTPETKTWVVLGVTLLGPVVAGLLIKGKVFSPATVDAIVQQMRDRLDQANGEIVAMRAATVARDAAHQVALDTVQGTVVSALSQIQASSTPAPQPSASQPSEPALGLIEPSPVPRPAHRLDPLPRRPEGWEARSGLGEVDGGPGWRTARHRSREEPTG